MGDRVKQISQRYVPSIFASVEPAELILLEGQPVYAPVAGTSLLWVSNTESDLFRLGATGAFKPLIGLPLGITPAQGHTVGRRQSMVHMATLADGQPITRARGHKRVVASSMDHTAFRNSLAAGDLRVRELRW
ncbi:MAG: hypothetical protein ND866_11570 [Pyrinomonadaceae bacterium]|nr:hypothetical protein [Pyrinomonadaceae bacterium]